MSELKPCPFCGGEAEVTIRPRGFRVECKRRATGCPVNMRTHHQGAAGKAKEKWNVRLDEWISVDDRLPSKSGPYMTFNGKDEKPSCIQQRVHIYDSDHKWFNSDTVTHWKPLPEPPK